MRLLSALYFSLRLHRVRWPSRPCPPQTRRDRVYAEYGPSRRLVAVVALLWLLVAVLIVNLAVLTLRGLHVC